MVKIIFLSFKCLPQSRYERRGKAAIKGTHFQPSTVCLRKRAYEGAGISIQGARDF